jgi:hypothetical protein
VNFRRRYLNQFRKPLQETRSGRTIEDGSKRLHATTSQLLGDLAIVLLRWMAGNRWRDPSEHWKRKSQTLTLTPGMKLRTRTVHLASGIAIQNFRKGRATTY